MNAFIRTLPGVLDAIDTSNEVRQAFVFAAWQQVAGEQIAERTSPIAFVDKRLTVAVADRTWKRNLETLASQLLFRLNGAIGKLPVEFIEFRIAPSEITLSERVGEAAAEELPTLPTDISISSGKIRDRELRETVLRAAAACLARQK